MPIATEEEKAAKIAAVKAIYARLGTGDEAKEEIARLTGEAMLEVEKLGMGKVKYEYLHRYAESLLGRRK